MNKLQIGALILVVTLVVLFFGLPVVLGLSCVVHGFLLAFGGIGGLANVPI